MKWQHVTIALSVVIVTLGVLVVYGAYKEDGDWHVALYMVIVPCMAGFMSICWSVSCLSDEWTHSGLLDDGVDDIEDMS